MTAGKLTIAVDRLKVVVRRLPPNLPEDVFWDSVKPWANDDTVQWRSFVAGKISKRTIKENVPSRAYITFKTHESVAIFSREYDGHIFRDKSGRETAAVVEFAPYQKIPPTEVKPDKYKDTLLRDAHYTHWLDELENVKKLSEQDTLEAYKNGANEQESKPKTTPLLEALKAEKERAKEAALARRHALAQQEKESKKGGERKGTAKEPAVPPARVDDPAAASAPGGKSARTKRRPNPKDKKEKEASAPKVIIAKKPADGQAGSSSPTVAPAKPAKEPGESKKKGTGTGDAEGKPERKRPQISGSRVLDVALSGARKEREKAAEPVATVPSLLADAAAAPARERKETPPPKSVVTAPTPGTPGVLSINPSDAGTASPGGGRRRRVRTKRQPQAG
ncbi:hypothetical protein AURDEDRAFT_181525 [Auricularia subglabra TFB-10046 SS5]|nr:hypothetical protein AURDEDRAFT_181525 [Auricularia subglabra TFB-10046 SS5]